MTTRYEAASVTGAEPRTLIFPEGCFEALPFEVRLMAPWSGCFYIEADKLKPAQRVELMRQGYVLVNESAVLLLDAA
jgi:hypothetical protein